MKKLLLIFCLLISQNSLAKTKDDILKNKSLSSEQIGYEIAKEAEVRDYGFVDSISNMEMILKNEYGQLVSRNMQTKTLEVNKPGLGDKSISLFFTPQDVKGTATLSHSKILEPDDQWLYLPSLKRVKRISSKNKSGPFLGSEFAYEDITSQDADKFSYKYLRSEKCPQIYETIECFVMETYPKYEFSGYTKRVAWVDSIDFRSVKVDFYDRKNELLKTLSYKDYEKFLGKHWRAKTLEMFNHQTKKSTVLTFKNYKFKNGFTNADFEENVLSR